MNKRLKFAVYGVVCVLLVVVAMGIGCKKKIDPKFRADIDRRITEINEADYTYFEYYKIDKRNIELLLSIEKLEIEDLGYSFKVIEKGVLKKVLARELRHIKCQRNFEDVKVKIDYFRSSMKEAGLKVEDFSITEADLQSYEQQGYASEAINLKRRILNGKVFRYHEKTVAEMKEYAKKSGRSLEQLDISEKEILQKVRPALIKEGKGVMELLRKGTCENNGFFVRCPCDEFPRIREIQATGVTLEDLGTSEVEIKKYE